jgi:cysteine desulfurase family protein (TIGR01976 family)
MTEQFDVNAVRAQFPSLQMRIAAREAVFFDNPGGTQVPQAVIDAMVAYWRESNANAGGKFKTSEANDHMVEQARAALADMLNAPSLAEIIFGANMTTLTMSMSRSLAWDIGPEEEVVVTRMDHDANVAPWLLIAQERGAKVTWVDFDPADCTFPPSAFDRAITPRTRIVAVCYASNATGTINDVASVARLAHDVGALCYVDAVAYAPHGPIDVQAIDCDFLVCSAYKFFGPHVGVLWAKREHLERLRSYKCRPAPSEPPGKFETGTPNFEGIAGTLAAVEYLANLGRQYGVAYQQRFPDVSGRRLHLKTALEAIRQYEQQLSVALTEAITGQPGTQIHGLTDPARVNDRAPIISFTWPGHRPADIAAELGRLGVFTWHGHYYAYALASFLGVEESGGMVRVGAAHYNTLEEVEFLREVLEPLSPKGVIRPAEQ